MLNNIMKRKIKTARALERSSVRSIIKSTGTVILPITALFSRHHNATTTPIDKRTTKHNGLYVENVPVIRSVVSLRSTMLVPLNNPLWSNTNGNCKTPRITTKLMNLPIVSSRFPYKYNNADKIIRSSRYRNPKIHITGDVPFIRALTRPTRIIRITYE